MLGNGSCVLELLYPDLIYSSVSTTYSPCDSLISMTSLISSAANLTSISYFSPTFFYI